ncbi:glycosyltransferase [Bradyrhizobium manausense]|uniref:glycosyltransferase n=1 Tax=Bradyrhizobium manausense TaxID=989370 RepID=UPI001BABEB15|nr:glycosyltransferase [Bradyrhizobium manausense]MBR1089236.1 glycosyltransferase [Bradyrhizobium manausense]
MGRETRIRVLVVVGSTSRVGAGVAQSARLLAQAASTRGAEIEVLTLDDPHYQDDLPNWAPLAVRAFPAIGPKRYGFSLGLLVAALRSNAELVHVHGVWMFQCLAILVWALLRRKPYIVTPHGMLEDWIRKRSPILKRLISSTYQDRFLRGAATLHLLTEKERTDVAEFSEDGRATVVPNCVEPFETLPGPPGWWNQEFDGRDVYLFFGRIHEKKGCMELCSAWDALCSIDSSFRERSLLVFCGWNDGLRGFEDRVAEMMARHGNAAFPGPQYGQDKQRSFAAASFFVLPSKSEGLPMSVLEAWAAGKPTLMTAACNLAIGFEAGAALEIGEDEDGIRDGLTSASSLTPERRLAMAAAARSLVIERYSMPAVAARITEMYREALSR